MKFAEKMVFGKFDNNNVSLNAAMIATPILVCLQNCNVGLVDLS